MNLNYLPDIQFAEKDPDKIEKSIITVYEALTDRTLEKSDPIRLFLNSIAAIIIQQRILIDYTGKQNLLAYAEENYLDHIGMLVGTKRLEPTAAMTTLKIDLSAPRAQSTIIPDGIRATADDNVFFAVKNTVIIPTGAKSIEVEAVCTEKGEKGNGYLVGEIKKIVDPIPFVQSIINTTISEGGSNIEEDEAYRMRIRQAPEQFSSAGPDGAYEYHAKRASALIVDVSVYSPKPGEVEVRPLLDGGEIPGEEILNAVKETLSDRKVRPLTDNLNVLAPEVVNYDIDLNYFIDRDDAASATAIQAAVEKSITEFILWQKSKLGRDINPSELTYRIRAAGAKRVDIVSPIFTVTTKAQIAVAVNIIVNFGGLEDG